METEDIHSAGGTRTRPRAPKGKGTGVRKRPRIATAQDRLKEPQRSPLFAAHHADRYERQALIRAYQEMHRCRLIVVIGPIFDECIPMLEELVYDADPAEDLHMLLSSAGGDGEIAVRMARSAQARCRELTVIVPDQAKSAATILAMGAHHILMGPTSDLGPVDPVFQIGAKENPTWVAAKDIIAAVEAAEAAVTAKPDTYPLHASMLSNLTALQVQQARSALLRTGDLVEEALASNPKRSTAQVKSLRKRLQKPLVDRPKDHGAILSAEAALKAGLPVVIAKPDSEQWQMVWRLYAKYVAMAVYGAFEGATASQIGPRLQG